MILSLKQHIVVRSYREKWGLKYVSALSADRDEGVVVTFQCHQESKQQKGQKHIRLCSMVLWYSHGRLLP